MTPGNQLYAKYARTLKIRTVKRHTFITTDMKRICCVFRYSVKQNENNIKPQMHGRAEPC